MYLNGWLPVTIQTPHNHQLYGKFKTPRGGNDMVKINETWDSSIYNDEKVDVFFECTKHQKSKLNHYCKLKGISKTTLFKLFIEELRITQMDEPIRYKIEEINWKVHNLLGGDRNEKVHTTGHNDENGNKKAMWFSKSFVKF